MIFDYDTKLDGHATDDARWAPTATSDGHLRARRINSIGGGFVMTESELAGARKRNERRACPLPVQDPRLRCCKCSQLRQEHRADETRKRRIPRRGRTRCGERQRTVLWQVNESIASTVGLETGGILARLVKTSNAAPGESMTPLLQERGQNQRAPAHNNAGMSVYAMAVNEENAAVASCPPLRRTACALTLLSGRTYPCLPKRISRLLAEPPAGLAGWSVQRTSICGGRSRLFQAEVDPPRRCLPAGLCRDGGTPAQIETPLKSRWNINLA